MGAGPIWRIELSLGARAPGPEGELWAVEETFGKLAASFRGPEGEGSETRAESEARRVGEALRGRLGEMGLALSGEGGDGVIGAERLPDGGWRAALEAIWERGEGEWLPEAEEARPLLAEASEALREAAERAFGAAVVSAFGFGPIAGEFAGAEIDWGEEAEKLAAREEAIALGAATLHAAGRRVAGKAGL